MKTLDENQLESIHGGVRQGPNGEGCIRPFPKPFPNPAPLPRPFPFPRPNGPLT